MSALPEASNAALVVALGLTCLMVAAQSLHLFLLTTRVVRRARPSVVVFESLLTLTFLVWAAAIQSAGRGDAPLAGRLGPLWRRGPSWGTASLQVPLEPLGWVSCLAAVAAVVAWVRTRRTLLLTDVFFLLVSSPLAFLAWDRLPLVFGAVATLSTWTFYLVRSVLVLSWDHRKARRSLSRFSGTEALARMPSGVLVVDDTGAVRLLNDAMRSELPDISAPGYVGDGTPFAKRWHTGGPPGVSQQVVALTGGPARLVTSTPAVLLGADTAVVTSVNVTAEHRTNRDLAATNEQLEAVADRLAATSRALDEVSREVALHRARSRVHDIVGQRLSILHRHLEDGLVTAESVRALAPLLSGIAADLSGDLDLPAATELEGVLAAFSLVDVSSTVTGALPEDPAWAKAFVSVIREAATNAVRHGGATALTVSMQDREGQPELTVSNNGAPARRSPDEQGGTGLRGVAELVTSLGGRFEVASLDPFSIRVALPPTPRQGPHRRAD